MTTDTQTEHASGTLEAAVATAVSQHQQAVTVANTAAQQEREQARQAAINQFQLPFDEATRAVLQPLTFRFEGDSAQPIAQVEYQGVTVEIQDVTGHHTHSQTWEYVVFRQGVEVMRENQHVYPNNSWSGYSTPEQRGQAFLLFLHRAATTPTPALETGTYEDFQYDHRREKFVKAALKGTLIGLTSTGVQRGACFETALFAIETAEQVLKLMDATPLQRQVLSVLSLEQFTDWVRTFPESEIVGSTVKEDHPICHYLKERLGVKVRFSNLALITEETYVLGSDSTTPAPHELPLSLVGEWLPALLNWKTEPENHTATESDWPTFKAREVLTFLEPFQR